MVLPGVCHKQKEICLFKSTLKVGEVAFGIESQVELPFLKNENYGPFLVENSAPDVRLRLHPCDPDTLTLPPLSEEEIEKFQARCTYLGQGTLLFQSPLFRQRLHECVEHKSAETFLIFYPKWWVWVFDFATREIDAYYISDYERQIPYRFGSLLLAVFLPIFSSTMMHSSGVLLDDKVALFMAPSGGGKSTIASLAPAKTVLSDDQNIVRVEGDELMVYPTPWGRRTSADHQGKLGGFFLLEKANDFALEPLAPAEFIRAIWFGHWLETSYIPNDLKYQAFDLIYHICHQVPIYKLSFSKENIDWDAIYAAMA